MTTPPPPPGPGTPADGSDRPIGWSDPAPAASVARRSSARIRTTWMIVAAVVVGCGTWVAVRTLTGRDAVPQASVGGCVAITSAANSDTDISYRTVDCGDPAASWTVTETGGDALTCDQNEMTLVPHSGNGSGRSCVRMNVRAGDCWRPEPTGAAALSGKVDCGTADRSRAVEVVEVITTGSDAAGCPAASQGLPLVRRGIVYCFGRIG
jgi:hypothetical protein